jgi:hypothetical protein
MHWACKNKALHRSNKKSIFNLHLALDRKLLNQNFDDALQYELNSLFLRSIFEGRKFVSIAILA